MEKVTETPWYLKNISLDPDDEFQINEEDNTVDVGILGVQNLPELFGIFLEDHEDAYFTSYAVIEPYKREVIRIINFIGGDDELDGKELPILITDTGVREKLFWALRLNSGKDLEEEFMDLINDSINRFEEKKESSQKKYKLHARVTREIEVTHDQMERLYNLLTGCVEHCDISDILKAFTEGIDSGYYEKGVLPLEWCMKDLDEQFKSESGLNIFEEFCYTGMDFCLGE